MNFLHTADWHLGALSHPSSYRKESIDRMVSLARRLDVDFILCAGDIFDSHAPTQRIKDHLLKKIIKYKDQNFVFFPGNHDYEDKERTYHSLQYLKLLEDELGNVRVLENLQDKGQSIVYDDCIICSLPENLNADLQCEEEGKYKILVWHGIFPRLNIKNIQAEKSVKKAVADLLEKTGADYLALGDIHKCLQLHDRCWYPGALVQKTFACEDGLIHVELKQNQIKTTRYDLSLPKKVTYQVGYDEGMDTEQTVVSVIKKNVPSDQYIKLVFSLPVDHWATLDKRAILAGIQDYALGVKIVNEAPHEELRRENLSKIKKAKTIEEELAVIIEEDSYGLPSDKLLHFCKRYL